MPQLSVVPSLSREVRPGGSVGGPFAVELKSFTPGPVPPRTSCMHPRFRDSLMVCERRREREGCV